MKILACLAALSILPPVLPGSAAGAALLEPPDGKVYHGIQTVFGGHIGYGEALGDPSIQPSVRGIFLSVPGTRPPAFTYNVLRTFLHQADSIGFVPDVSLFLCTTSTPEGATDSIIAVSPQYDGFIDSLAAISAGAYGRRMFLRIGGEFNGPWNGYHPYLYPAAFQKIADLFAARDFRDSIATVWCYEPDGPDDFDSVGVNGPLWYPGDDYADWFGLDVFDAAHFDPSLPEYNGGRITPKGKSERFLALAREKGKPVFMTETSAKGVTITPDSLDSLHDWAAWFAKFWEFMDDHVEIKGFDYINQDWESTGYPGWGDARIQNSPYVVAWYREEMRRPKYIHLPLTESSFDPPFVTEFAPSRAFPNPARRSATIRFDLPKACLVDLRVFDVLGREVAALVHARRESGRHDVLFDASHLPDGVYFYRLTADRFRGTRKLLLIQEASAR
jgi:hypothetical protein